MLSRPCGTRLCLANPEIATAYMEPAYDGAWRIREHGLHSLGLCYPVSIVGRFWVGVPYGMRLGDHRPTVRGGVLSDSYLVHTGEGLTRSHWTGSSASFGERDGLVAFRDNTGASGWWIAIQVRCYSKVMQFGAVPRLAKKERRTNE
jgi:hypothetical protein